MGIGMLLNHDPMLAINVTDCPSNLVKFLTLEILMKPKDSENSESLLSLAASLLGGQFHWI
jgi:hypothetical protein